MIHTVYLDDTTINGRRFLHELSRYKKGVEIVAPAVEGVQEQVIPRGYLSSQEFRSQGLEIVKGLCKDYGIV
jgi:hypothetical protein